MKDLLTLPDGLPVPLDDGACDHLIGLPLPSVTLSATAGSPIDLREHAGTTVAYCYPMIGSPEMPPLIGWNEIPGARGCTPQACGFRDHHASLRELGVQVYGISTQPMVEQRAAKKRLHLPFELLNDEHLALTHALRLPTFVYEGKTLIKRLTMILCDGVIEHVFYPVFPPDTHAVMLLDWLTRHRATPPQR